MLKPLANSSPGLLQPWDQCHQRIVTLKALAKHGPKPSRTPSELASSVGGTGVSGLSQPWARIRQHLRRKISRFPHSSAAGRVTTNVTPANDAQTDPTPSHRLNEKNGDTQIRYETIDGFCPF